MSSLSPPPSVRRAREAVQRHDAAVREVVRESADVVRAARDRAREARRDLAREILAARDVSFPTLAAFLEAVAARLEISPLTVRNALRETFSADVLAECVRVLDDARAGVVAAGVAPSRTAA